MVAVERLSVDAVRSNDLLSAQHVHRYVWARELCAGLHVLDLACGEGYGSDILMDVAASVVGVDRDPDALAAARKHFTRPGLSFEQSDAREVTRRDLTQVPFDVLVCFEGIEHFDDAADVLDDLRQLARKGLRLLLSLPNEDKFVADNHFHVKTYAYDDVLALAQSMPKATVVTQFLAEGSVIAKADADPSSTATAELALQERLEPEYAHNWLLAVGFDPRDLERATTKLNVAAAPTYNSYMIGLEKANRELFRINAELRQKRLGARDSAAVGGGERMAQLRDELERVREELARYNAPRYRTLDQVRARLLRVPGLSVTWWVLRQQLRRRGRAD